MRKKYTRILLLAFSLLLIIGIFRVSPYVTTFSTSAKSPEAFPGLAVKDAEFIMAKRTELFSDDNPGVCFNSSLLPYDAASHTLYLSQDAADALWQGYLVSKRSGYKLYTASDPLWSDKAEAIRTNHLFTVWLADKSSYYELQLCITGTPVLDIATDEVRPPEEYDYDTDPDSYVYERYESYVGSMVLFDPEDGGSVVSSPLVFHKKGASTAGLSKSGYSLSLETPSGKKQNLSLLGMRSDHSWKLNALYTDPNRIREMTAIQIWQEINAADSAVEEPGADMRYVEVVMDNEYQGLYALVEPIDSKKLSLEKNDVLYKVLDWAPPTVDEMQDSANRSWNVRFPVRIRYPKNITDYNAAWHPMQDYVNWVYYTAMPDYDEVSAKVSLENLCDFSIYLMVTSASDNQFKNTYYAAKVQEDDSYIMYQVPWDMDLTFGNIYDFDSSIVSVYDPSYDLCYEDRALLQLKAVNPEEVIPFFMDRWQQYREDFLSDDALEALMRSNQEYLLSTGAALREADRWPDSGVTMDLDEILSFQKKRMRWLDTYFKEDWEDMIEKD